VLDGHLEWISECSKNLFALESDVYRFVAFSVDHLGTV